MFTWEEAGLLRQMLIVVMAALIIGGIMMGVWLVIRFWS
jgi:hypothetical protein